MIKHGNILVATDFSACADEALRRAKVLAGLVVAEVHLLHVLEPVLAFEPQEISLSPVHEITEGMRKVAKQRLAAYKEHGPIHTHLVETAEPPHTAICRFATELPADLIVIGRHGHRSALEHLLIGSVAERVVRHAPCSVLVTRPHGILAKED